MLRSGHKTRQACFSPKCAFLPYSTLFHLKFLRPPCRMAPCFSHEWATAPFPAPTPCPLASDLHPTLPHGRSSV